MSVSCREQYRQALMVLLSKEPFYYHFISQLRYKEAKTGYVAALSYERGHFTIMFDPEQFKALPLEEAVGVVCHEALHFVDEHCLSPFIKKDQTLWNLATDCAINSIIPYKLPEWVVTPASLKKKLEIEEDFPDKESAVFYLSVLAKYKKEAHKQFDQFCFGHGQWGDLSEIPEAIRYQVARMAEKAKAQAGGRLPGFGSQGIEELLKALEAKVPWQKELRIFTGRCGDFDIDATNSRPNKYGNFPKTIFLPHAKLLFAMDTSGSVDDVLLAQFLGEMQDVAKRKQIDIMFVDYDVQEVKPFKKAADGEYAARGRGGTDMRNIFYWLKDNNRTYDGIIICTDMETPFPTPEDVRGTKVLWVDGRGRGGWDGRLPDGIGKVITLEENSFQRSA